MKSSKTPALIVVFIRSAKQQWFVAAISLVDGELDCLVRSDASNLDAYVGGSPDEQLSFLRHRLSGAIQRGFDRLWGKGGKASRIVLIADQDLPHSTSDLIPRLAAHLDTWMTRPPITFFRGQGNQEIVSLHQMDCLVGPLDADSAKVLGDQMPALVRKLDIPGQWEVISKPTEPESNSPSDPESPSDTESPSDPESPGDTGS